MERITEEELEAQLQAAKELASQPDDGIDPEELEREISEIGYDEAYAPVVIIQDTEESQGPGIHRTNNFPIIFGIIAKLRSGKEPENLHEVAYKRVMKERKYEQLFSAFEKAYPNLYKKMVEVYTTRNTGSTDSRNKRNYYKSAAYNGMAKIARTQIDPEYNLGFLYGSD